MLIIPAIDLQGGQAVRLLQGDYGKKTVYSHDPVGVAQDFEAMGAKYLHVVDLDGAKSGSTVNLDTIHRIRAGIGIPMQLGGGVRDAKTVAMYLEDVGIDRVILGTVAISNPEFVWEMVQEYGPERIVVGVDVRFMPDMTWASEDGDDDRHCEERSDEAIQENVEQIGVLNCLADTRNDEEQGASSSVYVVEQQTDTTKEQKNIPLVPLSGFVATGGWTEDSTVNYLGFIDDLKAMGVRYLVVTDISRDGTLTSPNWDMYEKIRGINVVVSGGVACEADIEKAAKYYGVIVGKAYYEGRVDLKRCFQNLQI